MVLALHQRLYKYVLWTTYVIFALTILGLWSQGKVWLSSLDTMLNIYIALFLVYNFNPLSKHKMDEFSREIAFSAGILLLVTKGITHMFSKLGLEDESREKARETSEFAYEAVELLGR